MIGRERNWKPFKRFPTFKSYSLHRAKATVLMRYEGNCTTLQEKSLMSYTAVSLKNSACFLVLGIFSLCLASSTLAQGKPAGVGPPPNNNPNISDRVRQIDEGRLRGAETNVGIEEENQKRLQAAIVNMKDDFKRIQVLRNDIARNLVARKPLDYKLVADQTAEIGKRSSR